MGFLQTLKQFFRRNAFSFVRAAEAFQLLHFSKELRIDCLKLLLRQEADDRKWICHNREFFRYLMGLAGAIPGIVLHGCIDLHDNALPIGHIQDGYRYTFRKLTRNHCTGILLLCQQLVPRQNLTGDLLIPY